LPRFAWSTEKHKGTWAVTLVPPAGCSRISCQGRWADGRGSHHDRL